MQEFPPFPETWLTRQIECVSCKQIILVAESKPLRRNGVNGRVRSIHTTLLQSGSQGTLVNCPRCGADNRNWIYFLKTTGVGNWPKNFWPALIGFGITLVLLAILVYRHWWGNEPIDPSNSRTLILLIAVLVSGLIPIWFMTAQWARLREYNHLRSFRPPRLIFDRLSPPLRLGLINILFFTILFPALFYVLLPRGFAYISKQLSPLAEPTLIERIDGLLPRFEGLDNISGNARTIEISVGSLEGVLNTYASTCTTKPIAAMVESLQQLRRADQVEMRQGLINHAITQLTNLQASSHCQTELINNALISLKVLRDAEAQNCQPLPAALDVVIISTPTAGNTASTPVSERPSCVYEFLSGMIVTLEHMLIPIPPVTTPPEESLGNRATTTLEGIRALLQQQPADVGNATRQQIANEISILEKIIQPTATDIADKGAGNDFLKTWFKFVGTSSGLAFVFSLWAVSAHVGKINQFLPRPLFYSIANMHRVVTREASRALGLSDSNINYIQWMGIDRNDLGGITLTGLHRDLPDFDDNGHAIGNTVRAQHYEVNSDAWAHIVSIEITDLRVPRQVGSPNYAIPVDGVARRSGSLFTSDQIQLSA